MLKRNYIYNSSLRRGTLREVREVTRSTIPPLALCPIRWVHESDEVAPTDY